MYLYQCNISIQFWIVVLPLNYAQDSYISQLHTTNQDGTETFFSWQIPIKSNYCLMEARNKRNKKRRKRPLHTDV